jgi:energy-converting hydrogenase Eha subunit G
MDKTSREARERVAGMTRGIGYALAIAGLFVWFVAEMPLLGPAMLLAGLGDIAIAAFLRRRLERSER